MLQPFRLVACALLLLFAACAACAARPSQPAKAPFARVKPPGSTSTAQAPAFAASDEPERIATACEPESTLCRELDFASAHRTDATLTGEWTDFGGQRAYLSLPRGAQPPMPAILLLHSARGLTKNMQLWSDRLAEEGYAVLAFDFYEGKVADADPDAFALRERANAKSERNAVAVKAAYAGLSSDPRIQAPRVALVGWSFGGAWATYLSTELPDIAAVVTYAGNAVEKVAMAKRIHAPILMIRGSDDQTFDAEAATKFEERLQAAGKKVELLNVAGGHALADPTREGYSPEGDWSAFVRVREFLKTHLGRRADHIGP